RLTRFLADKSRQLRRYQEKSGVVGIPHGLCRLLPYLLLLYRKIVNFSTDCFWTKTVDCPKNGGKYEKKMETDHSCAAGIDAAVLP
ncbi:MAG: hypothetical protein U0N82_14090, partial [Oscillospiraceae bacterium]